MYHRLVHLGSLAVLVGLTTALAGSPAARAQRVESPVRTTSTTSRVNAAAPVKATHIQFTGPYGAMSATIRAVLTGGANDLPLLFTEATAPPLMAFFITKPFDVTSASRITGDIVSPMRVAAMPKGPSRSAVAWCVGIEVIDAVSNEALIKNGIALGVWRFNKQPIDTVLNGRIKADLSAFAGHRVYLRMRVLVEPEMLPGHRLDIVEVQSKQQNSIN